MWVQPLGQEDPFEKEMATHSSMLAWRIQLSDRAYYVLGKAELTKNFPKKKAFQRMEDGNCSYVSTQGSMSGMWEQVMELDPALRGAHCLLEQTNLHINNCRQTEGLLGRWTIHVSTASLYLTPVALLV